LDLLPNETPPWNSHPTTIDYHWPVFRLRCSSFVVHFSLFTAQCPRLIAAGCPHRNLLSLFLCSSSRTLVIFACFSDGGFGFCRLFCSILAFFASFFFCLSQLCCCQHSLSISSSTRTNILPPPCRGCSFMGRFHNVRWREAQ